MVVPEVLAVTLGVPTTLILVPLAAFIVGVTPSVPLGPVGPCGPCGPVAPVSPLSPFSPAGKITHSGFVLHTSISPFLVTIPA